MSLHTANGATHHLPEPEAAEGLPRHFACVLSLPLMQMYAALMAGLAISPAWSNGHATAEQAEGASSVSAPDALNAARDVAHEIGEAVWSAKTEIELKDAVDSYLDDPDIIRRTGILSTTLTGGRFPGLRNRNDLVRSLQNHMRPYGKRLEPTIVDGLDVMLVAANAIKLPQGTREAILSVQAASLYDVPIPMLKSTLGAMRAMIYLCAVADLILSDRPAPRRWILDRVLEEWINNWLLFLRMAILLRGDSSDVPPAMLRRAQPIDGHEMMREHAEQGTIFERLMGKVDG